MLKNIKHFEDLSGLPSNIGNRVFESFKDEVRNKNKWRKWYASRAKHRPIGDYSPYEIVDRMINANIGQRFDKVFSDFCHISKVYHQQVFLDEFKPHSVYTQNGRFFDVNYYVDEDGLIRANEKKEEEKKPVIFYSEDYRTEERHIITGLPRPKYWYFDKSKHKSELYKQVVVSGYAIEFESKSDPRFKRLNAEKIKAVKREHKRWRKRPSMSEHEFRRILKEREQKEREENLIKIISHGFDPVTSFRKRKKEKQNA
jgi:hypothetical protein